MKGEDAAEFVDRVINDPQQPVVLFAVDWCEFCWSVRKLFKAIDLPYQAIDLDSAELQEGGMAAQIRAVLRNRTGAPTIPQIFVGGRHIGGATDLFEEFRNGEFQRALKAAGVSFQVPENLDPFGFLPHWHHPG